MQEKDKSLLSYDEQTTITELADKHQITQKNTRLLIKYYTHFAKTLNIQNPTPALRKTLGQIALIFTEKSNFYKTLEGQQCPGICFSMNDILKNKSYSEVNNLVTLSKQILETVKFKEMSLKTETQKLMIEIEEGLKQAIIFEKLFWVFFKNTIEHSPETQSYKEKLINFSWYLYIDVKNNILKDSLYETNKMLMVSVLETIILNSLYHINPLILQKNSPKRYSLNVSVQKKEMMSAILETLLKEAEINSSTLIQYQEFNETFNNYFDALVSGGIIKSFSEQRFDFLCQRSLQVNFRKLDRKISKQIMSNEVDLRRLISYELSLERDHKKTAIEDKLIVKHKKNTKAKTTNPEPSKRYRSHRVLDLDNCEIELSSSSVLRESEISFPPNLILDNTTRMSLPGLNLNTEKDELKKFLMRKTRPYMTDISSYDPSVLNYIENTLNRISERSSFSGNRQSHTYNKSQNTLHAYEFYAYLTQQVWNNSEEIHSQYVLEQNEQTHECLFIIAIGTVLLSESENETTSPFVRLLSFLKPNMMEFFFAVIYVQQMDFPMRLKNSLKLVMENLVNESLWADSNFIEQVSSIVQSFAQIHEENSGNLALSCILQKISEYVSEKTKFIETELIREFSPANKNQLQDWSRKSIELTLAFVVYCPEILYKRMFDQLILCSMYGMSKFHKMPIRFHELIQAYNKSISNNLTQFEKTVLSVKSSFSDTETDIIGFYNAQFIGYLNYAFEIIEDKQKMNVVFELCGDFSSQEVITSPFRCTQQAIILSPKLKKSKSQTYGFKGMPRTMDKQNYEDNESHSININLEHEGHLGIVSFLSQDISSSVDSSQTDGKIYINLEINQANSRNPTRVKERKGIEDRESELCATQKGKQHPIFTQLRKIDEQ